MAKKYIDIESLRNQGLATNQNYNPESAGAPGDEGIDRNTKRAIRGIVAPKDYVTEEEILFFQFNPASMQDSKGYNWFSEASLGFSAPEPLWVSGQERVVSFELFFDATAESLGVSQGGNDVGYDTLRNYKARFPRGVMDMVEKLQSFQLPISEEKPRFIGNSPIPSARFEAPPILIFSFGLLYLECYLSGLDINYTLFDEDLIPRRAFCRVSLNIYEMERLTINSNLPKKTSAL